MYCFSAPTTRRAIWNFVLLREPRSGSEAHDPVVLAGEQRVRSRSARCSRSPARRRRRPPLAGRRRAGADQVHRPGQSPRCRGRRPAAGSPRGRKQRRRCCASPRHRPAAQPSDAVDAIVTRRCSCVIVLICCRGELVPVPGAAGVRENASAPRSFVEPLERIPASKGIGDALRRASRRAGRGRGRRTGPTPSPTARRRFSEKRFWPTSLKIAVADVAAGPETPSRSAVGVVGRCDAPVRGPPCPTSGCCRLLLLPSTLRTTSPSGGSAAAAPAAPRADPMSAAIAPAASLCVHALRMGRPLFS